MTIDDDSSIYVGGIPYDATEETLRRVFDPYGDVIAVKIINDRGMRGKCYGFVTFGHPRSAIDAISDMDGRTIGGRVVRVNGVKTRGGRSDFDRENFQQESESGRVWDRDRHRERDYDRERLRDRSDDRLINRDHSRDSDSERERGHGHVHNHDRARDSFFDTERGRDHDEDIVLEYDDQENRMNPSRNWGRDHDFDSDRDRKMDRNSGHSKFVETDGKRKSRKWIGSGTTNGHSREILSNANDHGDEQVEEELLRSTQRLEDLKGEIMKTEEGLEQAGTLVSELRQKSKKLEDLLINAKKTTSSRKTQLTKLHKCFQQVNDYTERLKSSEKQLQTLVEGAVSEAIGDAALRGGTDANGNA